LRRKPVATWCIGIAQVPTHPGDAMGQCQRTWCPCPPLPHSKVDPSITLALGNLVQLFHRSMRVDAIVFFHHLFSSIICFVQAGARQFVRKSPRCAGASSRRIRILAKYAVWRAHNREFPRPAISACNRFEINLSRLHCSSFFRHLISSR
jgi:hypothetical protein